MDDHDLFLPSSYISSYSSFSRFEPRDSVIKKFPPGRRVKAANTQGFPPPITLRHLPQFLHISAYVMIVMIGNLLNIALLFLSLLSPFSFYL